MFKSKLKYQILAVSLTLLIVLVNNLISFLPSYAIILPDTGVSSAGRIETSNTNLVSQQLISEQKYGSLFQDAQLLTAEGHKRLSIGDAETALQYWQQAQKIYQQLDDKTGVVGSLINQSLALQALGLSRRSCKVLVSAFKPDSQICEPSNQLENPRQELQALIQTIEQPIEQQPDNYIAFLGLQTLGDILRIVGNLEESETVLQNHLIENQEKYSYYDINTIFLSSGNTQRALYNKNKDLLERSGASTYADNAIIKAEKALKAYQKVSSYWDTTNKNITTPYKKFDSAKIQAQINILSLLLDLENWKKLLQLENRDGLEKLDFTQPEIKSLMNEFQKEPPEFSKLDPSLGIYARLNFAKSLIQLQQLNIAEFAVKQNTSQISSKNTQLILLALNEAKNAVLEAEKLNNQRLKAYSLGSLGYVYEQTKEWNLAKELTEKALIIAEAITAPDIAYQLQWQLGRIYKNINNLEKAKNAYDIAVKTLDSVRRDLLTLNQNIEFSFSKDVEPVYDEYLDLLLQPNTNQNKLAKKDNTNQDNLDKNLKKNLNRAIEVNTSLQLAKIENFLRCILVPIDPIEQVKKPPAAIIYPIFIKDKDRLEIIVKIPQSRKVYHRSVQDFSSDKFTGEVSNLDLLLRHEPNRYSPELNLSPAKKLYNWLIRPIEADLPKTGTLVFVLDSKLQNVPLAALYDGEHYLVDKYSIAISLGSQLANSKSLSSRKWIALLAGVSEQEKSSFPQLPNLKRVEQELDDIQTIVPSEKLLNENFRSSIFKEKINKALFSVVHIATHGEFSSDPDKTFIYAWDKAIKVNELGKLVQSRVETSSKPIELLVLSACKTAQGDKQAALGMAGVALKAEAHSIVASLWQVNNESTATFMKLFYQKLKAGLNKADTLQKVQKYFVDSENYKHPYFWAPFILVGNWL